MESSFLNRDQALSLWSGSTNSKTQDYKRTNPREYHIVRTHTQETTWIQDPASHNHHPVQDASSKQQTNKQQQQKQTQSSADRITTSLSLPQQRKNKQKSYPTQSLQKPLDQPKEGRNQKEERIQAWELETWEKETSNTIS